jgi:glycosyltransferase involved in cell wall biosynthesis
MSETESFGMVFCEAWARKKPVIGNINCGAVSTLIDNGVDGFLCSTVEEIIERIERLLTDKELAKKLGENGFEKVVNNYAWEMVADKVYNCYNKLIDR